MKLSDLAVMYSKYDSLISDKFSDSDDSLTLLAKRLSTSDIYKDKYIFFDEFSTFIPQEISIISELCKQSENVCISLTYDENEANTTLFMPTSDTINNLKKHVDSKVFFTRLKDTHFKSEELSKIYNLSPSTIRSKQKRALEKLRKVLG